MSSSPDISALSTKPDILGLLFLTLLIPIITILIGVFWPDDLRPKDETTYGFFHPFCDTGGGGERVLWTAIKAIQESDPNVKVYIYAWDRLGSSRETFDKIKTQFNLSFHEEKIIFIKLTSWRWLEASKYPRFTLLGQSIGSIFVGWEAMKLYVPSVFIDTTGFAFTYPFVRLFGPTVVAYVHYPTISSDMLKKVSNRQADFNNNSAVSSSPILSWFKLVYYRLFAFFYGLVGSNARVVMANSSWTANHIKSLWNPRILKTVFPPCDASALLTFPIEKRERWVVSVAQFRPEKNHLLQLQVFSELYKKHPELKGKGKQQVRLILVGSVRNDGDQSRVDELEAKMKELGLENNVEIVKNAPFSTLLDYLRKSLIGIHTMKDEHFGISVIEYMAAGLIPIAHDSAGPKMDILVPSTEQAIRPGYLAPDVDTYVDALEKALALSEKERSTMISAGRDAIRSKFSSEEFETLFCRALQMATVGTGNRQ